MVVVVITITHHHSSYIYNFVFHLFRITNKALKSYSKDILTKLGSIHSLSEEQMRNFVEVKKGLIGSLENLIKNISNKMNFHTIDNDNEGGLIINRIPTGEMI